METLYYESFGAELPNEAAEYAYVQRDHIIDLIGESNEPKVRCVF
jgi:hypothetical protein|eukprot:COSAG02_NODE_423_length_22576_cov_62.034791_4_plen_45_part_00